MNKSLRLRLTSLILLLALVLSFVGCSGAVVSLDDIPEYSGNAYVEINGNMPFFTDDEITNVAFESYSELDALGRCGVAFACIGIEIMPTEDRGEIANITPSGWEHNGVSNNNKYDFVENDYVYNRCHLIGFQLAGENDNERNLITGTRYLNIEGMLPFENEIDDYVEQTKNHVMYRVTPMFSGMNYVADGVLMEAWSVEDNGRGVCFCIYTYNVQPGVTINYFNGVNVANGEPLPDTSTGDNTADAPDNSTGSTDNSQTDKPNDTENENNDPTTPTDYVLNINSKKIHLPDASCVDRIKDENKENYWGSIDELIDDGYTKCGICKP